MKEKDKCLYMQTQITIVLINQLKKGLVCIQDTGDTRSNSIATDLLESIEEEGL